MRYGFSTTSATDLLAIFDIQPKKCFRTWANWVRETTELRLVGRDKTACMFSRASFSSEKKNKMQTCSSGFRCIKKNARYFCTNDLVQVRSPADKKQVRKSNHITSSRLRYYRSLNVLPVAAVPWKKPTEKINRSSLSQKITV